MNELTNQISNGMAQFAGYLSKTGVVSVAGGTAVITNQTNFIGLRHDAEQDEPGADHGDRQI